MAFSAYAHHVGEGIMPFWIIEVFFLTVGATSAFVGAVMAALLMWSGFLRGDTLHEGITNGVTNGVVTGLIGFSIAFTCWHFYRQLKRALEEA